MIKFYYNMIILGRITIDDVPDKFKNAVKELLDN
jgi:hypothetical protein